ncbi:hypothetical protein EYZ11_008164 [Aspergillus tanneri]|uniref:Uncharacterized protein n=1 Tax=Aspergillus tanneri TaxID=1220188 RepID=A0A4V3UNS6_9EURO|nr:uncharacterized protein ATNIH1004_009162 [Aspergillus tanneri]KAA8644951.1 hypothetical protein ATNIH1004_009162 [Aspergillus tanneri]THC92374.1 hypothetical protein EYZ11_008164 [Aspergillus tanneri]
MGKFLKVLMPWHRGAKKVSKHFVLDADPNWKQTDWDKEVFNPDWTLKPGWEVRVEGVKTRRGWEHVFYNKKLGKTYEDVDMLRRRLLLA